MFVPQPGFLIANRYLLTGLLGRGGMGEVWQAEDRELDRSSALKFMLESALPGSEARRRFMREAKLAARLKSPHAVQILGVGEHEGCPYLAMELLEGETLATCLERMRQLSPQATIEIASQIGQTLEQAHALGIVHRDLKPDNVWLCAQPEVFVKVFDFGIAKAPFTTRDTTTGALIGTPPYMSPEQAQGSRDVDFRTDLWALAVIILQCLIGERPFEALALGGLVLKIMAGPDREYRERVAELFPELEGWMMKALALQPQQRFQSAAELLDALRRHLPDVPLRPRLPDTHRSLPVPAPEPLAPVTHSLVGAGRSTRRRVTISLTVAAAALFIAWRCVPGGDASTEPVAKEETVPSGTSPQAPETAAPGGEPSSAKAPAPPAPAELQKTPSEPAPAGAAPAEVRTERSSLKPASVKPPARPATPSKSGASETHAPAANPPATRPTRKDNWGI